MSDGDLFELTFPTSAHARLAALDAGWMYTGDQTFMTRGVDMIELVRDRRSHTYYWESFT